MENWQQVQELFNGAIRLPPNDRPSYLDRNCSEDPALRSEIESLLSSYESAASFLEKPAVVSLSDTSEFFPEKFEEGKRFGFYEIIREIGAGGMGEVYLARDSRLDRKAAVKFLNEEFGRDPERLRRFIREAKAASALNHPNILTVYEIGKAEGLNFIATEFIEGKTLREQLSQEEENSLHSVLKIGIQVAEAISAAHRAGIIHRDIKPENIMIREDGYVKVLDFGLAKLFESETRDLGKGDPEADTLIKAAKNGAHLTSPGMIMGTLNYMSPEQALGKQVDARADIFSFGVVLYEMVSGRLPFEGETPLETRDEVLHKEPKPIEKKGVPRHLVTIIERALRKDPNERYQDINAMLDELHALQEDLEFQVKQHRSLQPDPNESETKEIRVTTAENLRKASASGGFKSSISIKKSNLRNTVVALISVFLLGAAAIGYWYFVGGGSNRIDSIAVMPFANESGDRDVEYLSDGMTETLINSLSRLPDLNVKARSAVFRYKGKETNPKTIARELNVQAILNGRIVQRGDHLTLSLELINVQTENVLWGHKYERLSSELVLLQTEIARDVTGVLKSKLSGADELEITKTYTADPDAYRLYLKGRFQWNKRTGDGLKQAAGHFKQALEKDPGFALAYSGLAETYVLFADYNAATPQESFPKAKAAALRALELDPSLAEPHAVLGIYLGQFEWDQDAAEKELRRAVELKPDSPTAHQFLGYHLATTKRFDEALVELRKAEQLDPLSLIIRTNIGDTLLYARRYDEAIAQYNSILAFDPNFLYARINLGWALNSKGMYKEAIPEFRKAMEIYYEPLIKGYLAAALAKSGRKSEAIKLREELNAESSRMYVPGFALALAHLGFDEKDEALKWLEKDVAGRTPYAKYFAVVPEFDVLRSDPRFKAMLKRVDLPE